MGDKIIELGAWQVALAAALILINGAVSIALRLNLERRLFIASLRTIAQLLLVGLVLDWIFRLDHWLLVVVLMTVMTLVAGFTAVQMSDRRYPGIWLNSIVSMWSSSWVIAAVALMAVVQVEPWYRPQYAIPLLGMILGNTLNGISLGLNRLSEELVVRRDEVETLLALGASRWEAAQSAIRKAIRTGMIPIINSMMIVGIVNLPGMMTGQLLAGADPRQAVRYQIVIMFMVASSTALGTVSVVLLSYGRLFNARHQFLHEMIVERR